MSELSPERLRRIAHTLHDGGYSSEANALEDMAEEMEKGGSVSAIGESADRATLIHEHDCPKVWDFYKKHALGSKLCPSCFGCGHQAYDRADWWATHGELPDIYLCKGCVEKLRAVSATRESIIEECAAVAMDAPCKADDDHEYRWEDTYKTAAWEIAHAIRKLKNSSSTRGVNE